MLAPRDPAAAMKTGTRRGGPASRPVWRCRRRTPSNRAAAEARSRRIQPEVRLCLRWHVCPSTGKGIRRDSRHHQIRAGSPGPAERCVRRRNRCKSRAPRAALRDTRTAPPAPRGALRPSRPAHRCARHGSLASGPGWACTPGRAPRPRSIHRARTRREGGPALPVRVRLDPPVSTGCATDAGHFVIAGRRPGALPRLGGFVPRAPGGRADRRGAAGRGRGISPAPPCAGSAGTSRARRRTGAGPGRCSRAPRARSRRSRPTTPGSGSAPRRRTGS
jgi:hypothetical protein